MTRTSLLAPAQKVLDGAVPRVDFHMHTTWTDGHDTVVGMHQAAISHRLEAILFSEHARRTSDDWFGNFAAEVRKVSTDHCRAWVGAECKVLDFDGGIDTCEAIIKASDLVMASVHRFPDPNGNNMQRFADVNPEAAVEIEMRLMLAALDNPAVDILGHPFGISRSRFKKDPSEAQFRAVIEKAAATGVAFEINSQYHANPCDLVRWCREAGALVSLGSNAHRAGEVGDIVRALEGQSVPAWSIETARREGTLP
ncbi:MAG: hypothetical protein EXQ89_08320 [Rhodospirillaceae bacterium]|nr:hypothetical protein [Rhodospirillaceae bacterium]